MKTSFLLNQHCRCKALLEMIQTCDGRIKDYKERIEAIEQGKSVVPYSHKGWLLQRWKITLAVKERLAESYARNLARIIRPTVDKILETA